MFLHDTIAAIATPLGEGGIGIIRLSGPAAVNIAARIFRGRKPATVSGLPSHTVHYGFIVNPKNGETVDECLLLIMRSPRSYTKEDVVEIHCHGGMVPLRNILELCLAEGARTAEPGEFTKRAFLNGRIDLAQAEAVIDVIRAKTDTGLRLAMGQLQGGLSRQVGDLRSRLLTLLAHLEASIDFPEEDINTLPLAAVAQQSEQITLELEKLIASAHSGKIIREGLRTVIVGKPNVGKSSLLNALLQEQRAIVTDVPGTTRDVIEEYVSIRGIPLKIVDTAGIRATEDLVERLGVERARELLQTADLVLLVLDASRPLSSEDYEIFSAIENRPAIVLVNKTDLPEILDEGEVAALARGKRILRISLMDNTGLAELTQSIEELVFAGTVAPREHLLVTNTRHKHALERARDALREALAAARGNMPPDCIAMDLKAGWEALGEITGETVGEDIIDQIFAQFCIGK